TLEDTLLDADKWLTEGHIERPRRAADQAMARLEAATTNAAAVVRGARPAVQRTFTRIERGVSDARKQMAELEGDLREGMRRAREGIEGIDPTMEDFAEILAAIDEGRGEDVAGTLGRLIDDPQLYDDVDDAADSLREGVGAFTRFKSWLGLRIEYNVFARQPRF